MNDTPIPNTTPAMDATPTPQPVFPVEPQRPVETDIPMPPRSYRPSDSYIHANVKGTGSACRIELHPAHDETAGSIFLTLAAQKTVGGMQGGKRVYSTFDWENKIVVKLDRTDLAQILQVLRGMQESIGDGRGLFHQSSNANTVIKFTHQIEPYPGYFLAVSRKFADGRLNQCYFIFDPSEAFTLMLTLEHALMYICLGIPYVRPQAQTMAMAR